MIRREAVSRCGEYPKNYTLLCDRSSLPSSTDADNYMIPPIEFEEISAIPLRDDYTAITYEHGAKRETGTDK